MITIIKIKKTCSACPSQWEGITSYNCSVYVRFRHGWLTVSVGEPNDLSEFAGVHGTEVFSDSVEGENGSDGVMSYDRLKDITSAVIVWPEFSE